MSDLPNFENEIPEPAAPPKKRGRKPRLSLNQSETPNLTSDQPPDIGSGAKGGRKSKVDKEVQAIAESLAGITSIVGMGVGMFNPIDGQIVLENSGKVIDAFSKVLRTNDQMRALFLKAAQTSGFVELAVACASIALPIAANHGMLPPMVAMPFVSVDTFGAMMQQKVASNGSDALGKL